MQALRLILLCLEFELHDNFSLLSALNILDDVEDFAVLFPRLEVVCRHIHVNEDCASVDSLHAEAVDNVTFA